MTTNVTGPLSRRLAIALCLLAALAVLAPTAYAGANAKNKVPAADKYHGTVTAVDTTANTITIQKHKAAPITFTVAPNAKIKVSKAAATLQQIQVGYAATVISMDGKTATRINAHPKVAKGAGKNAAKNFGAPGTPGALPAE